ncbi:GNAT family N-acetyltransferase [Candidatus Thioglobus sp.]|nr:GNAT family N-acetyltransferase [Candidatus Thioglobus sp.]
MKELDVFISGETVNLCIPTLEFAKNSQWYSWFNNKKLTRYLDKQGLFPVTAEMQAEYFNSQNQDRLILIVSNKSNYMGVVSLSSIDMITNTCEVATIVDPTKDFQSPYIVLESVALITQYAFDVLGINRISGGNHMALSGWRRRMELLGYMVEGIKTNGFVKGREVSNSVTVACVYDNYQYLLSRRNGNLWDSKDKFEKRFKQLPKEDFAKKLNTFYSEEREKYYKKLFNLVSNN